MDGVLADGRTVVVRKHVTDDGVYELQLVLEA